MMNPRRRSCLPTTAALLWACLLHGSPTQAGDINWSSPMDVTGISDLLVTGGGVVSAFNGGDSSVVLSGINFGATDLLTGQPTGSGLLNGASTGNLNYNTLLDTVDWGGGTNASSITLGDGGLLTAGRSYTLQVWYTDKRNTRTMRYGDGATPSNTVELNGNAGSYGQYVTGTFTATGSTQTLTLAPQGFGNAHFNALLLQNTAPPIDPKASSGWSISSQSEWTQAYSIGNYNLVNGEANPTAVSATFESRVQLFAQKQSFSSITFKQTATWGTNKWNANDGSVVEPSDIYLPGVNPNAPVLISPREGEYYYLNGRSGPGDFEVYTSSDMRNWTQHTGILNEQWLTSAEYKDGTYYVYYDQENDQDPHLLTFTDLTDISTRVDHGRVFDDPNPGSDMAIFRDLDGTFHIVHEDWSRIPARNYSWDGQIAGHTTSPDGENNFNDTTGPYGIQANLFDESGSPTGAPDGTYQHPQQGTLTYTPYTKKHVWGDYELIRVGDMYYLFADDDPENGNIGVGYWYSDDVNGTFTYGGQINNDGHPDPAVIFAEGQFVMFTQQDDLISDGPWVDAVMAQAGVDTDGDGVVDVWTDWQDISETYGRIEGFAKVFSLDPAMMDLSELPDGYGIQFRYSTSDIGAVMDSVVIESVAVPEPGSLVLLGLGGLLALRCH